MKPCADLCGAGVPARMLILAVGRRQVSRRDAGATATGVMLRPFRVEASRGHPHPLSCA